MALRLATLQQDGWELESGEARHRASPESFWIPSRIERANVKPGQAVKLLFLIQLEDPNIGTSLQCERMWVLVSKKVGKKFLGFLDTEPVSVCNLTVGEEVYFSPEHVIDIGDPPKAYYEERLRLFTG